MRKGDNWNSWSCERLDSDSCVFVIVKVAAWKNARICDLALYFGAQ